MKKEILRLTKLWYQYVGMDHHKDRDCHWSIEERFSYGDEPTYEVYHFGYIFEERTIKCKTKREATRALLNLIKEALNKKLDDSKYILNNKEDSNSSDINQSEFLVKNYEASSK